MTIFKRKDSKFYTCEFTLHGVTVRKSTKTTDREEAEAWEARRKLEVRREWLAKNGDITLYEVAQKWLQVSEVTHKSHASNLSRVRKLFGDRMLRGDNGVFHLEHGVQPGLSRHLLVRDLCQADLMALKEKRMRQGQATATFNREIALLQVLVGYAASLGLATPNPPIRWSNKHNRAASLRGKEPKGKLRWLTLEEEAMLLGALELEAAAHPGTVSYRDAFELSMFLLGSGARYSEIATMKWSAIDLQAGTYSLYRSKTDNESVLTLPGRCLNMLRDRWERMKAPGYKHVFPSLRQGQWGKDEPRSHAPRLIQQQIDGLGLNDDPSRHRVTPHTFRHTYASRLLQNGLSLAKLSKLLGHANTNTTEIYAHLCIESMGKEAASLLNAVYNPPPTSDPTGAAPLPSGRPRLIVINSPPPPVAKWTAGSHAQ